MKEKIINIVFIVLFLAILTAPMVFADFSGSGVSENENRYLADLPKLTVDGKLNEAFSAEVEDWLMDHMGFRQELVRANAALHYHGFRSLLNQKNFFLGVDGSLNYATEKIRADYAHTNLYSPEKLADLCEDYQKISDYFQNRGIQFYYVQCYDKQSIYPEQFMDTIYQYGEKSRTDCLMEALAGNTTVDVIDLKEPLLAAKAEYEVYSNWGDPTHWTPRGARVGYRVIMERINLRNGGMLRVLEDEDFTITQEDQAQQLSWYHYEEDILEKFNLKSSAAVELDADQLGQWGSDARHRIWENPEAGNDQVLLLVCDSYFASYIARDFAESFGRVILIWADYTWQMTELSSYFEPDILIFETVERASRNDLVPQLASRLP